MTIFVTSASNRDVKKVYSAAKLCLWILDARKSGFFLQSHSWSSGGSQKS